MANSDDRYSFNVEYYDTQADLVRKYQIVVYANDGSTELYDLKTKKLFLKRTVTGIQLDDFFVGAVVTVAGRQLIVTEYGDQGTKVKMEGQREETLAIVRKEAFGSLGKIIDSIYKEGFRVFKIKNFQLSKTELDDFAAISRKTSSVISENIIALVLQTEQCVKKWRTVIAPSSRIQASNLSDVKQFVYGSETSIDAQDEISFFYRGKREFRKRADFQNSTCCVIKPHAVHAGHAGIIIQQIIDAGFQIHNIEMHKLEHQNAQEFLEVYKGVVNEYLELASELTNGFCIALHLKKDGCEVVQAFRELCGPSDPSYARVIRPNTLRAQFGDDKIRNAVHCTDLTEDGPLEVEYFFRILQ